MRVLRPSASRRRSVAPRGRTALVRPPVRRNSSPQTSICQSAAAVDRQPVLGVGPAGDGGCLDLLPGSLEARLKAWTPRTCLARFADHRYPRTRVGEQRHFVKTAPRIRPAQQEGSLDVTPEDFWTALHDLRPEHGFHALGVRPGFNRPGAIPSSLGQDRWTKPGAPGVTHDVVGDDVHPSLAQAARPVTGAGTDLDQGRVPGEAVKRLIAGHPERVLVGEVLSDLTPVVRVVTPARGCPMLRRAAPQLGGTDPAGNAGSIRRCPFLEVRIPGHGKMLENRGDRMLRMSRAEASTSDQNGSD